MNGVYSMHTLWNALLMLMKLSLLALSFTSRRVKLTIGLFLVPLLSMNGFECELPQNSERPLMLFQSSLFSLHVSLGIRLGFFRGRFSRISVRPPGWWASQRRDYRYFLLKKWSASTDRSSWCSKVLIAIESLAWLESPADWLSSLDLTITYLYLQYIRYFVFLSSIASCWVIHARHVAKKRIKKDYRLPFLSPESENR